MMLTFALTIIAADDDDDDDDAIVAGIHEQNK